MRSWLAASSSLVLPVVLAACGGASAPSAPLPPGAGGATLREQVDQSIRPGVESGYWIGVVVGVFDRGRTEIFPYGRASRGGPPLDGRSLFEIGSITKTYTAALLAGLVREGVVALADPVRDHLPRGVSVPDREGVAITLQHLSSHVSGLPRLPDDFFAEPGYDALNPYARYDEARLYAFLARYRLPREPGAQYEYSNVAVGLLGHALAYRLGTPYEAALRARVTAPLGLSDTVITLSDDQRARLAVGHSRNGQATPNWRLGVFEGAGALLSSAEDQLRYLAANLGRAPTPLAQDLEFCRQPRYSDPAGAFEVGLGWHIRALRQTGRRQVWHNGGTGGYRSFISFLPERDAGVVVLVNTESDADAQGEAILEWLLTHP